MGAHIQQLLEKRKSGIVKKWFDLVVDTYPPETSNFLKKEKDPFHNPVGKTTVSCLEVLFDYLLDKSDEQTLISHLDPVIRIRSIQSFSPSRAIGFIFFLKTIIRVELKDDSIDSIELSAIDFKIDGLMLMAFDLYARCRDTFYEIKANEEKNRFFKAFERAGLVTEITQEEQDLS